MLVYESIVKVQNELGQAGVAKNRKNTSQGYNFRGIDDFLNVLSPVLSKHGLAILPQYSDRTVSERDAKGGGKLYYVTVKGTFEIVATDGTRHTVTTYGEAMDSGDKATNKAMSAAYKYMAIQAFSIPIEGFMLDSETDMEPPHAAHVAAPSKADIDLANCRQAISTCSTASLAEKIGKRIKENENLSPHSDELQEMLTKRMESVREKKPAKEAAIP